MTLNTKMDFISFLSYLEHNCLKGNSTVIQTKEKCKKCAALIVYYENKIPVCIACTIED